MVGPNIADDELLLSLRAARDIDATVNEDWSARVVGPMGRAYGTIPDKGFNPFEENMPTRDRWYHPNDIKRRVLNPVDVQDIAYIPEGYGEKTESRKPTLNEEADQLQQEYDSIPDSKTPIPGLEDLEPTDEKEVGNLDPNVEPDTGRLKDFSRPIIRKDIGLMRLGGPQTGEDGSAYIPAGYGQTTAGDPSKAQETPNEAGPYIPLGYGESPATNDEVFSQKPAAETKFEKLEDLPFGNLIRGMSGFAALYNKGQEIIPRAIENMGRAVYSDNEEIRIKAVTHLMKDFLLGGVTRSVTTGGGKFGTIDELGMFGGRMAQGQQSKTLEYAEKALARGENPEAVKDLTGWYKNEKGEMEFLINPKQASLLSEPQVYSVTTNKGKAMVTPLVSLVDHPTLYTEFPELAQKGFVQFDKTIKPGEAEYNRISGLHMIRIHPDTTHPDFLSTMVHEINHGLQEINNFARGGDYIANAKVIRRELQDFVETGKSVGEYNIPDLIRRQYPKYKPTDEQIHTWLKKVRDDYAGDWQQTLASLSRNIGMDLYHRAGGEVKSRLSQSLLQLSEAEIRGIDFSKAGDVPVRDRIFDYTPQEQSMSPARQTKDGMQAANDNFGVGEITSGLVSKLNQVIRGEEPSKSMTLIQRDLQKLEQQVTEMEGSGRKVIAEDVANWLEMAGIEGVTVRESPTGTKYIKFPDQSTPYNLGQVRVPTDEHITVKPPKGLIETGSELPRSSSNSTSGQRTRALNQASNVSGGSFGIWENLVDALKWRLSKSPDGQWLISPGQEPKVRQSLAAKAENTGDTISRDPNQLEMEFYFPQKQQQQQGGRSIGDTSSLSPLAKKLAEESRGKQQGPPSFMVDVLNAAEKQIANGGAFPTNNELASLLGLDSKNRSHISSISRALHSLADKNYVMKKGPGEWDIAQPQIQQQQQGPAKGSIQPYHRVTSPEQDKRIMELAAQGMPRAEIAKTINGEFVPAKPITGEIVQNRIDAEKRLQKNKPAEEQVELGRGRKSVSHDAVRNTPEGFYTNKFKDQFGAGKNVEHQVDTLNFIERSLRAGDDFPNKAAIQKAMQWKNRYAEALYFQTMTRLEDAGYLVKNKAGKYSLKRQD